MYTNCGDSGSDGPKTILLVDDDPDLLLLTERIVTSLGYHVIAAESAAKAIQAVQTSDVDLDLILLDLVMPTMNGAEAFPQLREICPNTTIVFYTAYLDDDRIRHLVDSGEAGHIRKGLHLKELATAIRRYLPSE